MILKNIRHTVPPKSLLKIETIGYELVWVVDYYDVPLTGLLLVGEELFWFECTNENKQRNEYFRQYAIVKLSKKQLYKQQEKHRCFQKYVGTHWDKKQLIEPPKRIFGQEEKYYDKYLTDKENYENNEVIGWFEI